MNYFTKAPELRHNGEKNQSPYGWGKAIRTHELEAAINNGLGQKDFAMHKLMLFLTGNAEGFKVPEKTVLQRCNISESGYKRARKKLAEMGWIFYKPGQYIQVNYNRIFKDFRDKSGGCSDEPREDEDTVAKVIISNPQRYPSGKNEFPQGAENRFPENTHNNINNKEEKIENKDIKDKGFRCEDTSSAAANAAAPSVSSQPLREFSYDREKANDAIRKYKKWETTSYEMMMCIFDDDDKESITSMKETGEYKAFLTECEEKRQALYKEYGNTIYISPLKEK